MKRLMPRVAVFAVLVLAGAPPAFATGPQGESGPKGPASLIEKGWVCFADESMGMWAHCAPPGEDTFSFPRCSQRLELRHVRPDRGRRVLGHRDGDPGRSFPRAALSAGDPLGWV